MGKRKEGDGKMTKLMRSSEARRRRGVVPGGTFAAVSDSG